MEEARIDPAEEYLDPDRDLDSVSLPDPERFVDEADWDASARDVTTPLTAAEEAAVVIAQTTARLWTSFADAIAEARATPWEWVPCAVGEAGSTQRGFAERAVVADIAARLRMAESTVRTQAHLADAGRRRLPQLWALFASGAVSAQHLCTALDAATGLEGVALDTFDSRVSTIAPDLPAARLAPRARLLAERLNPESLAARRRLAEEKRGVWVEPGRDGMAWLTAHLSTFTAAKISARLDAAVADLARAEDETRTRDQLRADVCADLLTGDGTPSAVTATVSVAVPVLTLLGADERPATLNGWTPIDPETAREITASAPSFLRVLPDPIDSTVLDVGRRFYRPPADLARFVRHRDQECTHPGCARRAADCDLDHIQPRASGGVTSADNLHPACPPHHRQKHQTLWTVGRDGSGRVRWTSPSGYTAPPDPAPF